MAVDTDIVCRWCSCSPCVAWCPAVVRGERTAHKHDALNPGIRELVSNAKARINAMDYKGRDAGDGT